MQYPILGSVKCVHGMEPSPGLGPQGSWIWKKERKKKKKSAKSKIMYQSMLGIRKGINEAPSMVIRVS